MFLRYKTQGIIIKRTNLGEFDRLLTVYTKDFGKILIRGKSIRKNQAKLKGHLELFFINSITSSLNGNINRLINC